MRCCCCGLAISGNYHVTQNGDVCESCWNDPNLFFAERIRENGAWKYVNEIFISTNENEKLIIPVLKLKQKDVTLYSGKIKARDILRLYAILGFEEQSLIGYQRELYEDQINDLVSYIINCPTSVLPGLFISLRGGIDFSPFYETEKSDFGHLHIPLRKGAIWIIDGQHRIGGFEKILAKFSQISENDNSMESLKDIFEYDIPVTFIDTKEASDKLNTLFDIKTQPEDIERLAFFIINKTQRRLSPSLVDTLQYCISRVGLNGIPAIDKAPWRGEAASIGIDMNALGSSPFFQKINISGQRGLNRPIQLNSFVSSLKPLFQNKYFLELSIEEKKLFLHNWWSEIKNINNKSFLEKTYRNFLILKAIGIYTLNFLALDFVLIMKNNDFIKKVNIKGFIKNIKGFDWSKNSSPLSSFGGMKGVHEARKMLHQYIIEKKKTRKT